MYEKEIKTTNDNTHPPRGSEKQKQWHNGIYVAILKKNWILYILYFRFSVKIFLYTLFILSTLNM